MTAMEQVTNQTVTINTIAKARQSGGNAVLAARINNNVKQSINGGS